MSSSSSSLERMAYAPEHPGLLKFIQQQFTNIDTLGEEKPSGRSKKRPSLMEIAKKDRFRPKRMATIVKKYQMHAELRQEQKEYGVQTSDDSATEECEPEIEDTVCDTLKRMGSARIANY